SDGTDELGLSHDGTDAYFQTTDGAFTFQTDEGTNTDTYLNVKPKGTGEMGFIRIYDDDSINLQLQAGGSNTGVINSVSGSLRFNTSYANDILMWNTISSGNPYLYLYGYDSGATALKYARLNIDSAGDFNIEAESGEVIRFRTGGSDKVTIDNSGSVGIGTTSPSEKLVISAGNIAVNTNYWIGTNTYNAIEVDSTNDDMTLKGTNDVAILIDSGANSSTDAFRVLKDHYDPESATELFRINESGYIGIGTSSPQALTHVGSAGTPGSIDGTDDLYVYDDLEVDGTIYGNVSGTISPGFTEGSVVFADSSGNLDEDNANFFWLDGSDYLGIGTTAPSQALEIDYGHLSFTQEPAPGGSPAAAVNPAAGNLNGTYYYMVTFVTTDGETEPGSSFGWRVTPVDEQMDLSGIPTGSSRVIARKIYRRKSGGVADYKLVDTINDNVTTIYTDNIAEGSLGAVSSYANTTGGNIYLGDVKIMEADEAVTLLGYNAGRVNGGQGHSNTFIGNSSGYSNTVGEYNTFIGNDSGYYNTEGKANTYVGEWAGYQSTTGGYNVSMGYGAGSETTEGEENVFIGGYYPGYGNTTGSYNTYVGSQTGMNTDGSLNIFLGYKAGYNESGSNKLYIENTNSSTPLIWGDFDNDLLTVHGNLGVGTTSPQTALGVVGGVGIGTTATGGFANAAIAANNLAVQGNVGIGITAPSSVHPPALPETVPMAVS
ncbi:hypothetical protein ACFL0F_02635, partial [Patescibacteria group bacterium]